MRNSCKSWKFRRFFRDMLSSERCKSWNPKWREAWKNNPETQRKSEEMRKYLVLQRNMIRTHNHAAEKMQNATRRTEWRRKKSKRDWTAAGRREVTAVTRPREQILTATNIQQHPRTSPKVASSRLNLQMHC